MCQSIVKRHIAFLNFEELFGLPQVSSASLND